MKAFLFSHAGRMTIGIYLACLIIAVPDALNFLVAGAAVLWSIHHFRLACGQVKAKPVVSQRPEPALAGGDTLDVATALNMAASGTTEVPTMIILEAGAEAATPERRPARLRLPA